MVTRSKNIVESDPNNQKWKPNRYFASKQWLSYL